MDGRIFYMDMLKDCKDIDAIDPLLTRMGVSESISERIKLLRQCMGIDCVFGCTRDPAGIPEEEDYRLLKLQLIEMNEIDHKAVATM